MGNHKRQQSVEAESQGNTRQDRNTFVTDGGTWTWDSGLGELTWSATVRIRRGGVTADTINAGSISGVTAGGDVVYVDVDRASGGSVLTPATGATLGSASHATDERVVVGVRGVDGKFYFRNGTVMSDGDSKLFGQLNSVTDRNDITADGNALQNVGFTFVAASNQLAVYVGGILQTLGIEYVETGTTQVTFQAGYIPTIGERISFVNIIGGEGPAATGTVSLQDAWAVGNLVDVSSGSGVGLIGNVGQQVLAVQSPTGSPVTKWFVRGDGLCINNSGTTGFALFANDLSGDTWLWYPLDDGGKDMLLLSSNSAKGIRLTDGGLMEWGQYSGPLPGGSWSGEGGIRWQVEVGTLSSGAPTDINIGSGLTLLGVSIAFFDSGTGRWMLEEFGSPQDATRQFFVTYDATSGDLTISGDAGGTTSPGSGVDGEAFQLVIFRQG